MTVSLLKRHTLAAADAGRMDARRAISYASAAIVRAKFTAPPAPAPVRAVTASALTFVTFGDGAGLSLVGPHGTVEVQWTGGVLYGRALAIDPTEPGAFTCAEIPAFEVATIRDLWGAWDTVRAALRRAYGSAFDVSVCNVNGFPGRYARR